LAPNLESFIAEPLGGRVDRNVGYPLIESLEDADDGVDGGTLMERVPQVVDLCVGLQDAEPRDAVADVEEDLEDAIECGRVHEALQVGRRMDPLDRHPVVGHSSPQPLTCLRVHIVQLVDLCCCRWFFRLLNVA